MPVLILTTPECHGLLRFEEGVAAMRAAYQEHANAPVDQPLNQPRTWTMTPNGFFINTHVGVTPSRQGATVHQRAQVMQISQDRNRQFHPGNGQPVFSLYDSSTGELLMVMIGESFPEGYEHVRAAAGFQTACCAAACTDLMARDDARVVGIIGSGEQAKLHLGAWAAIRTIDRALVYSPTDRHREDFARFMTERLSRPVEPMADAETVVTNADVLFLCTDSNVPVLDGRWLRPNAHVTSIVQGTRQSVSSGLLAQTRQEVDDETLRRAALVATTGKRQEELDQPAVIFGACERGVISWNDVIDITELIRGEVRVPPTGITFLHNAAGWGVGAGAYIRAIYDNAIARGVGLMLNDLPGIWYQ